MESPYHSFLKSIFGSQYQVQLPYLHTIHLYCLFIVTLVVTLCTYTIHATRLEGHRTFEDRVHALRVKYATSLERPSDN